MIAYLLLSLLFTNVNTHLGCIHDQIVRNQKLIPINDTYYGRRLQTS